MKKHELLGEILKINAHFPILENYSISHIIIHFHVFFISSAPFMYKRPQKQRQLLQNYYNYNIEWEEFKGSY